MRAFDAFMRVCIINLYQSLSLYYNLLQIIAIIYWQPILGSSDPFGFHLRRNFFANLSLLLAQLATALHHFVPPLFLLCQLLTVFLHKIAKLHFGRFDLFVHELAHVFHLVGDSQLEVLASGAHANAFLLCLAVPVDNCLAESANSLIVVVDGEKTAFRYHPVTHHNSFLQTKILQQQIRILLLKSVNVELLQPRVCWHSLRDQQQLYDYLGLEELSLQVLPIPTRLLFHFLLVLPVGEYPCSNQLVPLTLEPCLFLFQLLVLQFEEDLSFAQFCHLGEMLAAEKAWGQRGVLRQRLWRGQSSRGTFLEAKLADQSTAVHLV